MVQQLLQINDNSQRREYRGAVYDRVMNIQNVIHGGQIMADCNAFHGINSCLAEIARTVPVHPDLFKLAEVQPSQDMIDNRYAWQCQLLAASLSFT